MVHGALTSRRRHRKVIILNTIRSCGGAGTLNKQCGVRRMWDQPYVKVTTNKLTVAISVSVDARVVVSVGDLAPLSICLWV